MHDRYDNLQNRPIGNRGREAVESYNYRQIGLSSATLAQFTFKMCVATRNRRNSLKFRILGFKVV